MVAFLLSVFGLACFPLLCLRTLMTKAAEEGPLRWVSGLPAKVATVGTTSVAQINSYELIFAVGT